jgi:hypothetical protein
VSDGAQPAPERGRAGRSGAGAGASADAHEIAGGCMHANGQAKGMDVANGMNSVDQLSIINDVDSKVELYISI